jgi:hypothetical protein
VKKFLPYVLLILLLFPSFVWADSSGPLSPSTASNDTSIGAFSWSDPSSATSAGLSAAFIALSSTPGQQSQYLKVTGFSFSLPGAAIVNGVVLEAHRTDTGGGTVTTDNSVRLVKGGAIMGDNKASGGGWPSSPGSYHSYGSSTDLWGISWTASDINSANFGAVISANLGSVTFPSGNEKAQVDHMRITVYYSIQISPRRVIYLSQTRSPRRHYEKAAA